MSRKLLYLFPLLACFAVPAHAQNARDFPAIPSQRPEPTGFGSPAEEIRQRALIRHEEASHKEMIERAEEATRLSTELRAAFERSQTLGRDDLKKLERIEKLARKIRSTAGGSGDDEKFKDPPPKLPAALSELVSLSDKLNKSVRKTSRLVVSAAVIERSNELIELTRYIRSFVQP